MKHIIIGGCGFTGSHLAHRLLQQGKELVIIDIQPLPPLLKDYSVEYRKIDITNPNSLASVALNSEDVVYHLAAHQYHAPPRGCTLEHYFQFNVEGSAYHPSVSIYG